jgi:drug/metabolite transporter (DMT)-like permease
MVVRLLLGLLTLVGITVIWGTTFAIVKNSLQYIPAPLFPSRRFSLAAACIVWVRWDPRALQPGVWLGLLALIGFATQTIGIELATAAPATSRAPGGCASALRWLNAPSRPPSNRGLGVERASGD